MLFEKNKKYILRPITHGVFLNEFVVIHVFGFSGFNLREDVRISALSEIQTFEFWYITKKV